MSAIGVPIVSKRTKHYPPLPPLSPWSQSSFERATCLVTLAARPGASGTGLFVRVGSDLAIMTADVVVGSAAAAMFASAEFYVEGGAEPQHDVKLNPRILFERCQRQQQRRRGEGGGGGDDDSGVGGGMVLVGLPKVGRPKFEDAARRGLLQDLPPMPLCCSSDLYPIVGSSVLLISHPFGGSKISVSLSVSDVDLAKGTLTLAGSGAPDGCHGSPILYGGKCVAILLQNKVGVKAKSCRLMHKILPKHYWEDDKNSDYYSNGEEDSNNGKNSGRGGEGSETTAQQHNKAVMDYDLGQMQDKRSRARDSRGSGSLVAASSLDDASSIVTGGSYADWTQALGGTGGGGASITDWLPNDDNNNNNKNYSSAYQQQPPAGPTITKSQAFLLTEAVRQGNLESIVRFQHVLGPSTLKSWRDFNGRSLVHFAVFHSNPLSLSGLRLEGYDVFAKTKGGDTAVHIACYQGSVECLRLLHRWSVPLHAPNNAGDTPCHKAALRGRLKVLTFLRGKGVDIVSCVNGGGRTPLDVARESGTAECVELLEAAAREDENGGGAALKGGYGGMHVPDFYLTREDWASKLSKVGDAANRNIRTREQEKGREERGVDDDFQRLFLTAKSGEASKRAERKVERAHQHWFAEQEGFS